MTLMISQITNEARPRAAHPLTASTGLGSGGTSHRKHLLLAHCGTYVGSLCLRHRGAEECVDHRDQPGSAFQHADMARARQHCELRARHSLTVGVDRAAAKQMEHVKRMLGEDV